MADREPPARVFEHLVRQLLEKEFDIQPFGEPDTGFDFLATSGGEKWAIEVKYYRTERAQATLLEAAATRLVARGVGARARKGMLIVSSILPPPMRRALKARYSLALFDRTDVLAWAAGYPKLFDEIEALLEVDSSISSEQSEEIASPRDEVKPLPENPPPEMQAGSDLSRRLRALKRGKATWGAYEKLCDRILRYLFPQDLHGWHKQRRTDDGLNRFDYVCRIRPTTDFWRFLIEHMDSRYVLFEFKNYTGKIKQGQILTTEKYLLEKGLRRVAIIVTRAGAHKDAIAMTQGAMREYGKLMLILDDEKICDMLVMKERGEDPSDRLFGIADDFLLSLPR